MESSSVIRGNPDCCGVKFAVAIARHAPGTRIVLEATLVLDQFALRIVGKLFDKSVLFERLRSLSNFIAIPLSFPLFEEKNRELQGSR